MFNGSVSLQIGHYWEKGYKVDKHNGGLRCTRARDFKTIARTCSNNLISDLLEVEIVHNLKAWGYRCRLCKKMEFIVRCDTDSHHGPQMRHKWKKKRRVFLGITLFGQIYINFLGVVTPSPGGLKSFTDSVSFSGNLDPLGCTYRYATLHTKFPSKQTPSRKAPCTNNWLHFTFSLSDVIGVRVVREY